jgi:hypothetical protein
MPRRQLTQASEAQGHMCWAERGVGAGCCGSCGVGCLSEAALPGHGNIEVGVSVVRQGFQVQGRREREHTSVLEPLFQDILSDESPRDGDGWRRLWGLHSCTEWRGTGSVL